MDRSLEDDEDEQLRLAIAMSLQSQAHADKDSDSKIEKTFIDLLDEDEPVAVVKSDSKSAVGGKGDERQEVTSQGGLQSFLGLDRKAMETERLARINATRKRKASVSPPPTSRAVPAKVLKPSYGSLNANETSPASATSDTVSTSIGKPSASFLQYPIGVVKKTWSFGYPRDNDIKLEEVLQRSSLQLAVLSSFQWDIDWLFAKLDISRSKVVLVMQAKDESTKVQYKEETASMANLRLCFPSMTGNVNCMHSKLMLLSYPTHLRIVVPTANLVPYDWGELGVLENSVFLIDLPRLPSDASAQSEDSLTFFGKELLHFCRAMGISSDITKSLLRFDFSATEKFAFVHTIGGEHTGPEEPWKRTGMPGLGRAVKKLGLDTTTDLEVDFIASSIGSLNMDFLSTLYLASQGDDGSTEYNWRTATKPKGRNAQPTNPQDSRQNSTLKAVEERFRLFFPSRETILRSKGGLNAAGPICFQKQWWEGAKFPRMVMRDCKSSREGLLMHNKIIYVRPTVSSKPSREGSVDSNASTVDEKSQPAQTCSKSPRPWAYIGSANCSESAWGRLVLDRSKKVPKLGCRNWECGVLVPVAEHDGDSERKLTGLEIFKETVPVPIEWPGELMEGKTPWFFMAGEGT